jgi:hypothetical protein
VAVARSGYASFMAQGNKKPLPAKAVAPIRKGKGPKVEERPEKFRRVLREIIAEHAETLKALAK